MLNIHNVPLNLDNALNFGIKKNEIKAHEDKFLYKIAKTNATVLLLGESGTGKSKLALKIHKESAANQGPFVEIQCTTIPESLLESELFGHEKGSFTGAYKTQIGKAEQAIGGTLFLDEIGELNLASQAKLLKLMQDKVVTRIGSTQDMKIDTRIIVATNRNLWDMVQSGSLRRDLYYRMNIFEVRLQNLSQRKKDILTFVKEFISEFNLRENLSLSLSIKPDLEYILSNYSWPGNIRELKNVIDRLCYLTETEELDLNHLPEYFYYKSSKSCVSSSSIPTLSKIHKSLKQIEKEHIEFILKSEANYENAAEVLGITTVTLWRKRKEYSLL